DELDEILDGAEAAGLATRSGREWLVTAPGLDWLRASTAARWQVIADGFRDALPAALRTPDGAILRPADWPGARPLDPDWVARAAMLPAEIDRIYLQADLSAIAPGPLAPALDLRLRDMAVRESRAQASTYRFTAESIAHAVGSGETAESLRAFLSELSLTGIPQPLAYLIDSTASRHGLIRVSAGDGHTRVDSDDAQALATLEVDQSVRAIGLVRDGDGLVSRVTRDAVYWTLVDARYPAVAVDAAGDPEPLRRRRLAPDAPASTHPHERLLATLRRARET